MEKRKYRSLPWEEWYDLSFYYHKKYGNLLVPTKFITSNGYKLGRWIERQRKLYQNNSSILSHNKIKKLEEIGMIWCLEKRYHWDFWFALCIEYKEEYNNLAVPQKCVFKGFTLGYWLAQQKKCYKSNLLSEEKSNALNELGFCLKTIKQQSWDDWYELAREYHKKYKDLNIKVHYVDDNGYKLGLWLYSQKEKYNHKKRPYLTKAQIMKLNKLSMIW